MVDDDKAILKFVHSFLTEEGYDVTAVSTAHEFYYRICSEPYAVAIIDIGLPDQSGLVLAQYARKNTEMRIIIFSGHDTIDDQLAAQKAGADLYLVKPVDFRQLPGAIAILLNRIAVTATAQNLLSEQQPSQELEKWRLINRSRLLLSPVGKEIKLTLKEFDFMTQLASAPREVSLRLELLKKLGYFDDEAGNHTLQSLVSRLRIKIASSKTQFPIQTSRSIGQSILVGGSATGTSGVMRYELGGDLAALHYKGDSNSIDAGISYPVLRTRNANLTTRASYGYRRLIDSQADVNTHDKQINNATVIVNGDRYDKLYGGGYTSYSVSITT